MITLQQFASAMWCTLMTAEPWHQPFLAAMAERAINTPRRVAAFLAQVGHESASLSHVEESLNYSAQRLREVWPTRFPTIEAAHYYEHSPERLANLVYADRMGNGSYESGDGWAYHGRGPIQLTGCDNYRRAEIALHLPLLHQPELALQPAVGARIAAWYWEDHGCNALADQPDGGVEAITRRINGGTIGLDDRRTRYERALKLLEAPA
jgi:putative chitinase